jgi:hypothetical protein
MKIGVVISSALHVTILTWGLWNISAPKPFEVAKVETLPADFIPFDEFTRSVKGDEKARKREKPAPKETKTPKEREPAKNLGDTKIDIKTKSKAPPKLEQVEASAPPPSAEVSEPAPVVKAKAQPEKSNKETPVPTNEISSLNEPPKPVKSEKPEDSPAKADAGQKSAKLPEEAPLPILRPKPPKAKTAKTKQRKKPDEIKKAIEKASTKKEEPSNEDKIAALLNKKDPSATGKKRSTKKASLGSEKSNSSAKLSRGEMDSLRGAIEQCWTVPAGLSEIEDMRVTITMNLAKDGSIEGKVDIKAAGGQSQTRRAFAESARRAVLRCAPYNLPKDKYDTWSQVVVNFDPSQMF